MNSSTSFCDWSWAMVLHHANSPSLLSASIILGSASADLPVTHKTQISHKTTSFKRATKEFINHQQTRASHGERGHPSVRVCSGPSYRCCHLWRGRGSGLRDSALLTALGKARPSFE